MSEFAVICSVVNYSIFVTFMYSAGALAPDLIVVYTGWLFMLPNISYALGACLSCELPSSGGLPALLAVLDSRRLYMDDTINRLRCKL